MVYAWAMRYLILLLAFLTTHLTAMEMEPQSVYVGDWANKKWGSQWDTVTLTLYANGQAIAEGKQPHGIGMGANAPRFRWEEQAVEMIDWKTPGAPAMGWPKAPGLVLKDANGVILWSFRYQRGPGMKDMKDGLTLNLPGGDGAWLRRTLHNPNAAYVGTATGPSTPENTFRD